MFCSAPLGSHRDIYVPPAREFRSLSGLCSRESQLWGHLGPSPVLGVLPGSVLSELCPQIRRVPQSGWPAPLRLCPPGSVPPHVVVSAPARLRGLLVLSWSLLSSRCSQDLGYLYWASPWLPFISQPHRLRGCRTLSGVSPFGSSPPGPSQGSSLWPSLNDQVQSAGEQGWTLGCEQLLPGGASSVPWTIPSPQDLGREGAGNAPGLLPAPSAQSQPERGQPPSAGCWGSGSPAWALVRPSQVRSPVAAGDTTRALPLACSHPCRALTNLPRASPVLLIPLGTAVGEKGAQLTWGCPG